MCKIKNYTIAVDHVFAENQSYSQTTSGGHFLSPEPTSKFF